MLLSLEVLFCAYKQSHQTGQLHQPFWCACPGAGGAFESPSLLTAYHCCSLFLLR